MNPKAWLQFLPIPLLAALGIAIQVCAQVPPAQIVSFDVPGSNYTIAYSISQGGTITGTYRDHSAIWHGFVRTPMGVFTTFDPEGSEHTTAFSINPTGTIVGTYRDTSGVWHGFLRSPDGLFTTIDPPGATHTLVLSINPTGVAIGAYFEAGGVAHGFLLSARGTITVVDPPGSTYTFPYGINPAGAVTGYNAAQDQSIHGFLRTPDGSFSTIDAPGSAIHTIPTGINSDNVTTGYYIQIGGGSPSVEPDNLARHDSSPKPKTTCHLWDQYRPGVLPLPFSPLHSPAQQSFPVVARHGFVRADDGTFDTMDPPDSTETIPLSINLSGTIAGRYRKGGAVHGFVRTADGTFTTIDPAGSTHSVAESINATGAITGYYLDANCAGHGFLRASR